MGRPGRRGLLGSASPTSPPPTPGSPSTGRDGPADITRAAGTERLMRAVRPDVVVNAAVFTGVDPCEADPARAYEVNAVGARHVARACADVGARCVYISTDYVFDGTAPDPYDETAPPRPLLTYGMSKLAGEGETLNASPGHLVVRTAALFGPPPPSHRRRPGFVEQILRRAAAGQRADVTDALVMSPTYTADLARMVVELLAADADGGPYHVTNEGSATWYGLAHAAVSGLGLGALPRQAAPGAGAAGPARPAATPLTSVRLPPRVRRLNRPWRDALAEFLRDHGPDALAAARPGPPLPDAP
uniref:dTDP-4-dehydrorhamnose reductase n=1 Tax=Streptomyces griseoloalbus TaxID=67303 RepID=D1H0B8_9ACTN|nr:putative NDP-hexose 4-ketoreductase [Streptomyces albaduncus]